jgi:hypothetical protein
MPPIYVHLIVCKGLVVLSSKLEGHLYQKKMLDCKIFGGFGHRIEMDAPPPPRCDSISFGMFFCMEWVKYNWKGGIIVKLGQVWFGKS